MAEIGLDSPIWALIDTSHNGEKVASECRWFRAAAQSGEDEETCCALCLEADQKVARLVRTYR